MISERFIVRLECDGVKSVVERSAGFLVTERSGRILMLELSVWEWALLAFRCVPVWECGSGCRDGGGDGEPSHVVVES